MVVGWWGGGGVGGAGVPWHDDKYLRAVHVTLH